MRVERDTAIRDIVVFSREAIVLLNMASGDTGLDALLNFCS